MANYYDHHSRLVEHHQNLAAEYEGKRQELLSRYQSRGPKYFDTGKNQEMPRFPMQSGEIAIHDSLAGKRDDHMRAMRHHQERADILWSGAEDNKPLPPHLAANYDRLTADDDMSSLQQPDIRSFPFGM
jgi:hypothetical protein